MLVNYKDQEYLTNAISNANLLAPGDVTVELVFTIVVRTNLEFITVHFDLN